jgi:hypothetical protein
MADTVDIDNILEDDLLDALSNLGATITTSPKIEKVQEQENVSTEISEQDIKTEDKSIDANISLHSGNIDDIASLLKELLNNKSIEITIKLKDI